MKIRIDHALMWLLFGKRWKEKLWISKKDKRELENLILISTAETLTDKWCLKPISIRVDSEYPSFNPSIIKTPIGYILIARSSNLLNYNDGNYFYKSSPHRTQNFIVNLNNDLEITSQIRLAECDINEPGASAEFGFEDIRLFSWYGEIWAVGAGLKPSAKSNNTEVRQILFKLDGTQVEEAYVLNSPNDNSVEKNWMPLIKENELYFAYDLSPLEMVHYKNGKVSKLEESRKKSGDDFELRGGTPFVLWKGLYLGVAHSSFKYYKGKRYYLHHFITLDSEMKLLEVSIPFFIQRKGIEFASGLIAVEDGIVLSYGVADRGCRVVRIPDSIIEKYITL